MYVFGRQLLKICNRSIWVSPLSLRCYVSICAGKFKTADFCRQSDMRPMSRTCHRPLSAPVWYDHPRLYSTLHKTECDVHRFGEIRLTVGSWCDVTVSSLNPELYLDQNRVKLNDTASRLSVDCRNSEGISRVSVSENKETSKQSRQKSDVCNIEVPIKYGKVFVPFSRKKTVICF